MTDQKDLDALERMGVQEAVVGLALYTGKLNHKDFGGDGNGEQDPKLVRKTKETDVSIDAEPGRRGKDARCECDEQFLSHMLETFARYANFDLTVEAKGDNDHHLVEDVAIVLGSALQAGAGRDAQSNGSPRPSCPWTTPWWRWRWTSSTGRTPTSTARTCCTTTSCARFAMSSGITLHVIVKRGFDDHHMVEATFKALGNGAETGHGEAAPGPC